MRGSIRRIQGCTWMIIWCWCSSLFAQGSAGDQPYPIHGSVVYESLELESEFLGKPVRYNIYLPEDYHTSTMKYPVLYLLHGYSDDETGWTQLGQVKRIADEMVRNHEAAQMVIVMPDGGVSWYVNGTDGGDRYEDFFIQELMPHIEREYKVREGRQFSGVAGLSMGGYGALMLSLRHPDRFSSAGILSSGVFTDEEILEMGQTQWDRLLGEPFGKGLSGQDRLDGNYRHYSPEKMIAEYKEKKGKVRLYIDCGDDDFLILGNMNLHAMMIREEVPHEFRVRDGAHTWTYWRSGLRSILPFMSEGFHR